MSRRSNLIRSPLAVGVAATCWTAAATVHAQAVVPQMPPGWSDSYFDKLAAGRAPTVTVAVLEFDGGKLVDEKLRFRMADILVTALVQAGRFNVVERSRLDAVLAEQKLQASGVTDPATAVRVGRLLNAELVVYGVVTSLTNQKIDKFAYDVMRAEAAIDVHAVNTASGQIVVSQTAKGAAEGKVVTTASGTVVSGPASFDALTVDAIRQALDRVAVRLAGAFPLVGVVVRAENGTVYIDAGENRGVRPGDAFVVFRKGAELVHPVTKQRLGFQKTVLGTVQVTSTEAELAAGRVTGTADGAPPITPGDLVISIGRP